MSSKLIFLDCDCTLSSIEGIDELARLKGEAVFEACSRMTDRAMNGEIALEDVYGERLKLIGPSLEECGVIGKLYQQMVEPKAQELLRWLEGNEWHPIIVSGGITQVIEPFANFLGIKEVEAVPLRFDKAGNYLDYDRAAPTAGTGGKITLVERYRQKRGAGRLVMVGDGASDLETKPHVDLFVGYGGYVARDAVKKGSDRFVTSLGELPEILAAV